MSGTSGTSYTQKAIDVTITLGLGTFGDTGKNTVTLKGLRVLASIIKSGYPSLDRANVRVYGLPPSIMNTVSTLGIPRPMIRKNNIVTVQAGDTTNGMSVVYSGFMLDCYQDYSEAPETSLVIASYGGALSMIESAAPSSFPGSGDVATIMSGLALQMGMKFENNGVQVKLSSPYFSGSLMSQAHQLARAANIEMYPDTSTIPGTLAIWPKLGTRGGKIPLINTASGLVGYPTFQSNGMSFKTLFNPNIILNGKIQMQSSVGVAPTTVGANGPVEAGTQSGGPNGFWFVTNPLVHDLSAEVPGGPWFTSCSCVRVPGQPGQS